MSYFTEKVYCPTCHTRFERARKDYWRRLCVPCYKREQYARDWRKDTKPSSRPYSKAEHQAYMQDRWKRMTDAQREAEIREVNAEFKYQAQAYQSPPPSSKVEKELVEHIPALLRLTHPDKHGNSQTANDACRWLLEMREAARKNK